MGEIRLTYWREILEGKRNSEISNNPIAKEILRVLKDYNLPNSALISLIKARYFDLYSDNMLNMRDFEIYAGKTISILYQYSATILNNGRQIKNGNSAGHLGVAHALIGHLLAFNHNVARKKLFLPLNYFSKANISLREIYAKQRQKDVGNILNSLLIEAKRHLDIAKSEIILLPTHIRPAFAQIAILDRQLANLEQIAMAPYREIKNIGEWQKIWCLTKWALKNG